MARCGLSLGGNIGDVEHTIAKALDCLAHETDVQVIARSSYYKTPPWGGVARDWFINACVIIETNLSPQSLLQLCKKIEKNLGRIERIRWDSREIDIDILFIDGIDICAYNLVIPHKNIENRLFVLVPLQEINPEFMLRGRPIHDLIAAIISSGSAEANVITKIEPHEGVQ
jgi:2-amino-4-hydroxy-6-hydroxymethyldihydropteridine diphosphokinase